MPKPDGYVEVNERIVQFYQRFPEGSLCTERVEFCEWGDKQGVLCQAAAYRSPEDPVPGRGSAWEPFPGATNFTRNSEVQNAETSAWGRAIAAVGIAVKEGIATKEDVELRRQDPPEQTRIQTRAREPEPTVQLASVEQRRQIADAALAAGLDSEQAVEELFKVVGVRYSNRVPAEKVQAVLDHYALLAGSRDGVA